MSVPRVVLAGAGSGVGKTTIATGMMARLSKEKRVQGFKVGPDFIDPMFHAAATGRPSRNLDSFFMDRGTLSNLFGWSTRNADIAVVEGVRGLYDGLTSTGDVGSTAEIAKTLGAPVVLIVNARSLAKSAAAHVLGFKMLDPGVNIAGVILNQVSGERHRKKAVEAVESLTGTRVIGTIERQQDRLKERHLGLVTMTECDAKTVLDQVVDMVSEVDMDALLDIAEGCEDREFCSEPPFAGAEVGRTRIAVPRDKAFSFYYQENLEALEAAGAEIRYFRPTEGDNIPDADGVYLGGGYPEVYAREISKNGDFLDGLKTFSDDGRVIYGECGGLMTMCSSIEAGGEKSRMAGIIPSKAVLTSQRQGLAYVRATATPSNFLFPGAEVRAHEFHYSKLEPLPGGPYGFEVTRGTGIGNSVDGVMVKRSMGTYMHQHALANKSWGPSFTGACAQS